MQENAPLLLDDLCRRRVTLPASDGRRARSLILGKDHDVIPVLLDIHAPGRQINILDCTYNCGAMWRGQQIQPTVTMDIDAGLEVDVVADFTAMPFADHSFDVIVFDPPHLPTHAASAHSSGLWRQRYGITADEGKGRDGDNVSPMFLPFLVEARRVLRDDGIILAKIAGHFVEALERLGFAVERHGRMYETPTFSVKRSGRLEQ